MISLALYVVSLFFIGLGNAVVTYHILRYRDPDDLSGPILLIYYIMVFAVLIATALFIDWMTLF